MTFWASHEITRKLLQHVNWSNLTKLWCFGNARAFKFFKLSISTKFFWLCLFPTDLRLFNLKNYFFAQKHVFLCERHKNKIHHNIINIIRNRLKFVFLLFWGHISPSHTWIKWTCNLTPPPPKKKGPFFLGGGMFFWDKIINFRNWMIKKFSARLETWADCIGHISADHRPKSATNPQLKFQKYGFFGHFRPFLDTFFFKMRFASKMAQKSSKIVLLNFFRS